MRRELHERVLRRMRRLRDELGLAGPLRSKEVLLNMTPDQLRFLERVLDPKRTLLIPKVDKPEARPSMQPGHPHCLCTQVAWMPSVSADQITALAEAENGPEKFQDWEEGTDCHCTDTTPCSYHKMCDPMEER